MHDILVFERNRICFDIFAEALWNELQKCSRDDLLRFSRNEDFQQFLSKAVKLGFPFDFQELKLDTLQSTSSLSSSNDESILDIIGQILLSTDFNLEKITGEEAGPTKQGGKGKKGESNGSEFVWNDYSISSKMSNIALIIASKVSAEYAFFAIY